jgi:hypothetical protein
MSDEHKRRKTGRRLVLGGLAATSTFALAPQAFAQRGRGSTLPGIDRPSVLQDPTRRPGTRKIAFIPVFRPNIDAVPPDWEAQIQRRIASDPDPTGADISLRAWFRTTSYGRTDIEGVVLPRVSINAVNVPVNALASRTASLRAEGFDAAALVMLGGVGAGTAEPAGFWARFVMAEQVGVWAMELLHVLTGYWDLYIFLDPRDTWFDNMACSCGVHPCAFTKRAFGWLDASAIARHNRRIAGYRLQALALPPLPATRPAPTLPPSSARPTAVQVGSLMIEARMKLDPFDGRIPLGEGVIVYKVVSADEDPNPAFTRPNLQLKTRTPLAPGQTYTDQSGDRVTVTGAFSDGYSIVVLAPSAPGVPPLRR